MIKIKIVAVGNLKEKFYIDAVKEFEKRLLTYCNLSIVELKESKLDDNYSKKQIDEVLHQEAKLIEKHLSGYVVVLAVEGKQMSSESFAKAIEQCSSNGISEITFVIGSSYGLCDSIKQKADMLLSFSQFTFPHRIMRIVLLEQIYRSFTITNNKKYHK